MLSINSTSIEYYRQANKLQEANNLLSKLQTWILGVITILSFCSLITFAIIHFINFQ